MRRIVQAAGAMAGHGPPAQAQPAPCGPFWRMLRARVLQVFQASRARLPCATSSYFDSNRGCQRRSSSAFTITLTLDAAIAAPATTGLSRPKAAKSMPTTL